MRRADIAATFGFCARGLMAGSLGQARTRERPSTCTRTQPRRNHGTAGRCLGPRAFVRRPARTWYSGDSRAGREHASRGAGARRRPRRATFDRGVPHLSVEQTGVLIAVVVNSRPPGAGYHMPGCLGPGVGSAITAAPASNRCSRCRSFPSSIATPMPGPSGTAISPSTYLCGSVITSIVWWW